MSDRLAKERVEKVLVDILKSHSQLMKGIGNIVVDYALVNEAPIEARKLLEDIRMGEVQVTRWVPPDDEDDLEIEFG